MEQIVGTWRLLAATALSGGERNDAPYGQARSGLITYTADGRVMAIISHNAQARGSRSHSVRDFFSIHATFWAYARCHLANYVRERVRKSSCSRVLMQARKIGAPEEACALSGRPASLAAPS
ncbi:lipocalin-like domain-containing protein [Bradyrhizobium sp. RDM4]|uniref:lipocalin-like domain-containing protein n=1 Tax=Bradyrhizobium sp. RDM4 TaxID=3378765 RepID=UPI0038FC1CCE